MAGSITKRGENTYRLQVSCGSDITGKPIRYSKTVHCVSKREAEREMAMFYLECQVRKEKPIEDCTVSAFLDIWWKDYVEPFTKTSTRSSYDTAVRVHIKPELGELKIRELKALHIQRWVNKMDKEGLSAKTIKNYFSVINNLCRHAVKWDYIETNPCSKVTLPKRKKKEAKYYTEDEVGDLIMALELEPESEINYVTAVYIALFGGLRKGEILGLNEEDYLSEKGAIRIIRTRMLARGVGPYEDTPKTETSARIVSIPKDISQKIEKLISYNRQEEAHQGNKWIRSDALIKGRFGAPMYPQNLQRWFTRFVKKHNLPYITLHGLRHTHTALLVAMTDDIAQISRRLGHSEITTTLNIYTHIFSKEDRTIADRIEQKFFHDKAKEEEQIEKT